MAPTSSLSRCLRSQSTTTSPRLQGANLPLPACQSQTSPSGWSATPSWQHSWPLGSRTRPQNCSHTRPPSFVRNRTMRVSGGSPTIASSVARLWHGKTSTGQRSTRASTTRLSQGERGPSLGAVFASRTTTEQPTVPGTQIAPCSGGFQACRHGQSIVWHRSSRPQTGRLTLRFAAGTTTASASSDTASIAMPAVDAVGPTCSWSVHSDKGRAGTGLLAGLHFGEAPHPEHL